MQFDYLELTTELSCRVDTKWLYNLPSEWTTVNFIKHIKRIKKVLR